MQGIFSAALTPFTQQFTVDHHLLHDHCHWLLGNGCHGVVLLGTTGEANSMSFQQRLELIAGLKDSHLPAEKLIIGAGSCSALEVVQLIRAAISMGVTRVLVLPPFYYKPVSAEGLIRFFATIIKQVNEPFSVYLYHIPQLTGVGFEMDVIKNLIRQFPDHIRGIKDSSGDGDHLQLLCETFPDFEVLAGNEILLSQCVQAGGNGCISATANITAPIIRKLFNALQSNNPATPLQQESTSLRKAIVQFPVIPTLKELLAYRYKCAQWATCLPPLPALQARQKQAIQTELIEGCLKSFL